MASFLDTGLLDIFSVIFMFLLVYGALWGILTHRKPLGDNNGVYGILSLAVAFFVILSPPARAYIAFIAPWFLVLALVFLFIVIAVSMFANVSWDKVVADSTARTWILILIAIILVLGLAFSFGQSALDAGTGGNLPVVSPDTNEIRDAAPGLVPGGSTATGAYEANFINTVFHPKVLGVLLIFLLGTFVIFFLSRPAISK